MTKVTFLPVSDDFEARLFRLFERKRRHLLVGEVSLDTGFSIASCLNAIETLVARGAIRWLSYVERKLLGLHDLTDALVVVDPTKFTRDPRSDYFEHGAFDD